MPYQWLRIPDCRHKRLSLCSLLLKYEYRIRYNITGIHMQDITRNTEINVLQSHIRAASAICLTNTSKRGAKLLGSAEKLWVPRFPLPCALSVKSIVGDQFLRIVNTIRQNVSSGKWQPVVLFSIINTIHTYNGIWEHIWHAQNRADRDDDQVLWFTNREFVRYAGVRQGLLCMYCHHDQILQDQPPPVHTSTAAIITVASANVIRACQSLLTVSSEIQRRNLVWNLCQEQYKANSKQLDKA